MPHDSSKPRRGSEPSSRQRSSAPKDGGSARASGSGAKRAPAPHGKARPEGASRDNYGANDSRKAAGRRGQEQQQGAPRADKRSAPSERRPATGGAQQGRAQRSESLSSRGEPAQRSGRQSPRDYPAPHSKRPSSGYEQSQRPGRSSSQQEPGQHSRPSDTARRQKPQGATGGDASGAYAARADRSAGSHQQKGKASGGAGSHMQQGKPGAERFPAAEFARREGMLEGHPAHMVVNRSLKGYTFTNDFPWCLRLAVAYRSDTETGLPLPREERALEAFEQNLFGLLKKSVNGHYVGNTSWGGSREFVFYIDEGGDAEGPLNTFADGQSRTIEYSIEEDARWEQAAHYFDYQD